MCDQGLRFPSAGRLTDLSRAEKKHHCKQIVLRQALEADLVPSMKAPKSQCVSATDLPDERACRIPVQPPREKYFASVFRKRVLIIRASWPGKRGGSRVVTNAGQDAMDATAARANFRADERRFGGRRSRVVLTPRRWCQVCGSIRR